jgi:hypothetical protein
VRAFLVLQSMMGKWDAGVGCEAQSGELIALGGDAFFQGTRRLNTLEGKST